jgi:hypothetical protein
MLLGVGDLNGDGAPDVITYESTTITARLGAGDGTFTDGPAIEVPDLNPPPFGPADFDSDGRLDLLIPHKFSNPALNDLLVLRGNGDGSFDPEPAAKVTVGPLLPPAIGLLIGDVVVDGRPDIVTYQIVGKLSTFANLTYPAGGPLLDLGHAQMGLDGWPGMLATGQFEPGGGVTLQLLRARFQATAALVCGTSEAFAPFKGGTLVPAPDFVLGPYATDIQGKLSVQGHWPPGLPAGATLTFQFWIEDVAAAEGFAASTAVRFTEP